HSADAVVVLVCAVELELEAAEQVEDHDAQAVVQNPGAHTGQVLPPRLQLQQQAVKSSVYLLCLRTHTHTLHSYTHIHVTKIHTHTRYTETHKQAHPYEHAHTHTHTHSIYCCEEATFPYNSPRECDKTHPHTHTHTHTQRYSQTHTDAGTNTPALTH